MEGYCSLLRVDQEVHTSHLLKFHGPEVSNVTIPSCKQTGKCSFYSEQLKVSGFITK